MTRANQWLVFSSALSVVAGFFSGVMFSRRRAAGLAEQNSVGLVAFGRIFRVGSDIFIDRDALEYLESRADESIPGSHWTGLRFADHWMFLELFHTGQLFPGQQGPIYALRSSGVVPRSIGEAAAAANDAASRLILRDLERFGLLLDGGRWGGWHALELMTIAAQQDKEKQ